MSNTARPHRIRKLRWRVMTASESEAFTLRRDLRKQCEDVLMDVFEKGLDAVYDKNQVIHIPKLTLDLKVDSEEALAKQLPELLYQALRYQLQFEPKPVPEGWGSRSKGSNPSDHSGQSSEWSEASSIAEDHFAAFIFYLQSGIVPWHMAYLPASQIASYFKAVLHSDPVRLFDNLNTGRMIEAGFYFRLLQIHSDKEICILLKDLSEKRPRLCSENCAQALNLIFGSSQTGLSRYKQLRLATAFLSEHPPGGNTDGLNFLRLANKVLDKEERRLFWAFVTTLETKAACLFQPALEGEDKDFLKKSEALPDALQSTKTCEGVALSDLSGQAQPISLSRLEGDEQDSDFNLGTLKVNCAGLILLHPFLSALFKHCGFIDKVQEGLSPLFLSKAAAMLHFLATGREKIYEYELGLIKVLLGLRPETPLLVSEGLLKESDKYEATKLMEAVIQHWSVLKKTSLESLRSTFLVRQGLLKKEDEAWRLQMERESFDVLLDQLPWSIGIIKLPWMKNPVFTEW